MCTLEPRQILSGTEGSSQRIGNNWVSRSAFKKGDKGGSVASLHDTFLLGCSQNTATPGHQALPTPARQVNGQSGHSDARPARLLEPGH